jgi:hypothetical protein
MTGLVEAFRCCLFGTVPDWQLLILSGVTALCLCVAAGCLFGRLETDLAELV